MNELIGIEPGLASARPPPTVNPLPLVTQVPFTTTSRVSSAVRYLERHFLACFFHLRENIQIKLFTLDCKLIIREKGFK